MKITCNLFSMFFDVLPMAAAPMDERGECIAGHAVHTSRGVVDGSKGGRLAERVCTTLRAPQSVESTSQSVQTLLNRSFKRPKVSEMLLRAETSYSTPKERPSTTPRGVRGSA